MGLDAFLEIDTWKSYAELLDQIAFIVMARPNEDCPDADQGWKILENYLKATLSADYEFLTARGCYTSEGQAAPFILLISMPWISPRAKIRQNIKTKKTIGDLVPPQVAEFIQSKGLYT